MSRSNAPGLPPGGVSTRPPRQLNQPMPQQPQGQSDQLSQFRQPPQRPQPYAPQFDPYQGQPQPAPYAPQQQQTYTNPQAYEQTPPLSQPAAYVPPQQNYAQPAAPAPRTQVPAYDQWAQPAPVPAMQVQDPRGYDLGGYSAAPQSEPYQQHGYQQAPQGDWGQQQHYGQQQEPSLDASGYHQDPNAQHDTNAEYGEEEYEDEVPTHGRFMRIAAALAGAIVVGGGLAFAYTSLVAPGDGSPPVIKSAAGPNKIKPADAGGKKFANSEKKLMGQLNDGAAPAENDIAGVKKVGTVQVAADGTIIPPAEKPVETAAVTAPTAPAGSETAFPGSGTTLAAPPATDAPVTVTPPKATEKIAEKAVQVAAATPEAVKSAVSDTTTNSISAAAAATKPMAVAAPAPPKVKPVAAPIATAAATSPVVTKKPPVTASPTGAGYVAVLASVPVSTTSRINALKQFADMQQKYGSALQNKAPEVKEANLGEKGNYHRLLVGPPGSREGAQALCGSLKTAGYTSDCWVTAY